MIEKKYAQLHAYVADVRKFSSFSCFWKCFVEDSAQNEHKLKTPLKQVVLLSYFDAFLRESKILGKFLPQ